MLGAQAGQRYAVGNNSAELRHPANDRRVQSIEARRSGQPAASSSAHPAPPAAYKSASAQGARPRATTEATGASERVLTMTGPRGRARWLKVGVFNVRGLKKRKFEVRELSTREKLYVFAVVETFLPKAK